MCPRSHTVIWLEPRQTCLSCKCSLLLSLQADSLYPLDMGSATTLIHALMMSRVDYCNSVLAGRRGSWQVAAGPEFCCPGCPCRQQHVDVRLPVVVTAWRAPLARCYGLCPIEVRCADEPLFLWFSSTVPVEQLHASSRCHWSSTIAICWSAKMIVPHYRLDTFAVGGPSTWNSLPDNLHDPALSINIFKCQLWTYLS